MTGQPPQLDWRIGAGGAAVPVSTRFSDPYYSDRDGLAEARYVFLRGNDLPARAGSGFHVAELGFGTGLNLLALHAALECAGIAGPVHFTSFERYPIAADDMARALSAFPALRPDPLLHAWRRGARHFDLGPLRVTVIEGDARDTLPRWDGRADAWFLDGFAPARNPELWSPARLSQVAVHTAPGGSFATYTAAGGVRRALADAGFAVRREPGYGSKRHMTTGRLTATRPQTGQLR